MKSIISRNTSLSQHTQRVIQEVASKSLARIHALEGVFTDDEIRIVWNALGLYLSKNLRVGRGITIPKFGIFTFTPPEVRLPGVTNPEQRDLKPRIPVFVISKDFVKGKDLRPAVYYHQQFGSGIRPYTVYGSNGDVPVVKINLTEVASYANLSKDQTQVAFNRIIKHLAEKVLYSGNCVMQIPSVGTFLVRNNLVAVKFTQFLQRDTRNVFNQSLQRRKAKGDSQLTNDNLKKFASLANNSMELSKKSNQFLQIDDKTKNYLETTYGFHFNNNNQRRTFNNFDRTVASKQFNDHAQNLRDSHLSKIRNLQYSRSRFSSNQFNKGINYDYNMALKILKNWILQNKYNSESSFLQFMNISKSKKQMNGILNENDIWNACKSISIDITQQQSHELFRILDINRDGVVTFDDWNKIIKFDNNIILRKVIDFIKNKKLNRNEIISKLGLNGIPKFDVFKLQHSLINLCNFLSENQAFNLSQYIAKGEKQVSIESLLQHLQIIDENISKIKVDKIWESKFLQRVKNMMNANNIVEQQLQAKFELYNKNRSGFISQSNFKQVLNEVGIVISLPQLIKLVKTLPINQKNQIKYHQFINRLTKIQVNQNSIQQISFNDFLQKINTSILKKKPFPYKLPITLESFASMLQNQFFQEQSQFTLKKYLQQIDIDQNGQISKQDLDAFNNNQYRQSLSQSVVSVGQQSIKNFVKIIRQKLIKKQMTYHDLYKLLDSDNDGFVTFTQWNNIDKLLKLDSHIKQALFRYIDRDSLSLFDYKTFLSVIQDTRKPFLDQKFDWIDQVVRQIKIWYQKSKLQPQDAFKLFDKDIDGYISEDQFHRFLKQTLKYQQKQLTHVRIQKLIKIFDTYKRGKIDLVDFKKVLISDNDWVQNAKQQIGISISRKYNNINEAFNAISRQQKYILYNNFQKWLAQNKMTSGFMFNQNMIKQLFAHLDPHKKGYLSEGDFSNLFGKYNWKSSIALQLIDTLKQKFKSQKQAFKHLSGYKSGNIKKSQFQASIRQLFGERFSQLEIDELWSQISAGQNSLNFQKFKILFGKKWLKQDAIQSQLPRDSWVYQDYSIIKGTVNRQDKQHIFQQNDDIQTQCRKIVDSVKDILRTSPKTLQQAFIEADRDKRGVVTNLQFKHAFRILNIALTSKQIDLLLNFCDFGIVNLINYRDFIKKFNLIGQKKQIIERAQTKMKKFSDLLHYHMISPKDAYRKFNNQSTGYLSFQQFYLLVKQLYNRAFTQTLPQYTVIRELFDFIDIRKDGKIDYQQWVQVFRNYNPPSVLMGTLVPNQEKSKNKVDKAEVRLQNLPYFQQSQQYEQLTKMVGRNRKYLTQRIQKLGNKTPLIQYATIENLLREVAKQYNLNFNSEVYKNFVAFALTEEKVDYKLLLDAFKQRSQIINEFPKKKIF